MKAAHVPSAEAEPQADGTPPGSLSGKWLQVPGNVSCFTVLHGGPRTFHQKSTCLRTVDLRALCGTNLVT